MSESWRCVVVSDFRVPFEESHAISALLNFLAEHRPDGVVILGGLTDEEAAKKNRAEVMSRATAKVVDPLRRCTDGRVVLLEDQHSGLPGLGTESGVRSFAPGWAMLTNQTVEKYDSYSRVGGNSALNLAKNLGVSVVMGSTFRMGKGTHSRSNGDEIISQVTGVEVGHLSNPLAKPHRRANKEKRSQQGFGLIEVSDSTVSVDPICMNRRGHFTVGSQIYTPTERAATGRH